MSAPVPIGFLGLGHWTCLGLGLGGLGLGLELDEKNQTVVETSPKHETEPCMLLLQVCLIRYESLHLTENSRSSGDGDGVTEKLHSQNSKTKSESGKNL